MDSIKTLTNLGLSEKESSVYIALLKLGESIASVIAKEVSVKRTTIYALLNALAQKGFVLVYFRKNKRFYYAQKPSQLSNLFEKRVDSFNAIIPALNSLSKNRDRAFGTRYIETSEELKQFYFGLSKEYKNKTIYSIGDVKGWEEATESFYEELRKNRAKMNTTTKLLLTEESRKTNPTDKSLLREYKYLPKEYKFESTINIFKDKILIISPKTNYIAIVIDVPAMVDVFRSTFEALWKISF